MKTARETTNQPADTPSDSKTLSLQDIMQRSQGLKDSAELVHGENLPAGYNDRIRWPLWKSAALVITLSLGFWAGFAALMVYVFG